MLKQVQHDNNLNHMYQDEDDDKKPADDLEEGIHELMDEFDLDEGEAKKVEKLEDEGYDEEDAVAKAQDA